MSTSNHRVTKKFSDHLKKWRSRRNISQSVAAMMLDVSVDTLRGWEQDKHKPSEITKRFVMEITK